LAESLATQDDKEEVDYKRAQLIARQGELEAEKRKQREIEERLEEIERGKTEIESSPQRVFVEAYRFAERQPEAHQKVREVEKILNEKIKNAANELGVSPDDVKEQLLEAHGLFRQVRAIVSMGWAKNSKQWILKALAAIVIIPAAWTLLQIYYPVWQPIITKILAGLTTLLVLLKPHIKYVRNLLAPLTAAIEENRKLLEEERVRLQKELEKQQKLTTEKSAEVAAVREDLENLRADRKLANFIKQRNASADYARYQGVIARAHADFEQLSDLLLREQKRTPDNSEAFQRVPRNRGGRLSADRGKQTLAFDAAELFGKNLSDPIHLETDGEARLRRPDRGSG
jgi:predicted nuclease with TOPRIM domain